MLENFRITPTLAALIGLLCGLLAPAVALQGESWILAGAFLVLLTLVCDRLYPVAARIRAPGRRSLVFVPLASRLTELAWLFGFWKLGVPGEVVVAAGALAFTHEYVKARGFVAGLREIGISTLGERSVRASTTLAGFGVAGVVALNGSSLAGDLVVGVLTVAATAWLLLGVLGMLQVLIVVSAALREQD